MPPADAAEAPPRTARAEVMTRTVRALMVKADDAAALASVSRATWDRWTAAGLNPQPVKIGKAVLWSRAELSAWAAHGAPDRRTWAALWAAILAAKRSRK